MDDDSRKPRLDVGATIDHPAFGRGQIVGCEDDAYTIVFDSGDKRRILFTASCFAAGGSGIAAAAAKPAMTGGDGDLRKIIRVVLEESGVLASDDELGRRWKGGTLRLIPGDQSTQSKDVPIEAFFKKIIAVRDKLRVLEQKVNSSESLTPEEKLEYQGYITRSYGSLTTFNVFFSSKESQFRGTGGG